MTSETNESPRCTQIPLNHDQSWYWTEAWQAMEAEADRDLAEGRYQVFDSVEEFLRSLDEY